jgi:hypothetical protein
MTNHITANEQAMMDFAKQYQGKPVVEPQAAPAGETYRAPSYSAAVRTTIVNGEAATTMLKSQPVYRGSGDGSGNGMDFNGQMAVDPYSLPVKLRGTEVSAEQARAFVARGMYSQAEYDAAVAEAMKPYDPSFK